MALENRLGIRNDLELAREEERLSKIRASELFDSRLLDTFEVGTFKGLAQIHGYIFQDVYDFAGQIRTVNIAKGNFRFAPVMYLDAALAAIDRMPHKFIGHPFNLRFMLNVKMGIRTKKREQISLS